MFWWTWEMLTHRRLSLGEQHWWLSQYLWDSWSLRAAARSSHGLRGFCWQQRCRGGSGGREKESVRMWRRLRHNHSWGSQPENCSISKSHRGWLPWGDLKRAAKQSRQSTHGLDSVLQSPWHAHRKSWYAPGFVLAYLKYLDIAISFLF